MKKILSLILMISLLFSLAACGQKATATWQEQYDLGVRYLNEGKYEEAVIAFNAAIEIDPKQADAYIGLASVYAAQGYTDKAVEILEKAVAEIGETEELTTALGGLRVSASDNIYNSSDIHLEPPTGGGVSAVLVGGTLDIRDLQVSLYFGADEHNPDSVGNVEYSFTVYGPENTRKVLIGTWALGSFRQDEIPETVDRIVDMWRDYGIDSRGYESLPARSRCAGPIDYLELDTELETLLIGLDKDGNATGYAIIRQIISSEDKAAGLPTLDEITYFGVSPFGLTVTELEDIAAANGFYISGYGDSDYYWFDAYLPEGMYPPISGMQLNYEDSWCLLRYDHNEHSEHSPISTGLRDIYTLDSMATVLTKLGIANAEALAQKVIDICEEADYVSDEVNSKFSEEESSLRFYDPYTRVEFRIDVGAVYDDENGVRRVRGIDVSLEYAGAEKGYTSISFWFSDFVLTTMDINIYR